MSNWITNSLRNADTSGTKGSTKHKLLWEACKRKWYKLNPPDHAGYYYCHYCGKAMTKAETTLDHIKIRSHYPELRYKLENLVPCCAEDNFKRGSMEYELFCKKYYPNLLQ